MQAGTFAHRHRFALQYVHGAQPESPASIVHRGRLFAGTGGGTARDATPTAIARAAMNEANFPMLTAGPPNSSAACKGMADSYTARASIAV